MKPDLKLVRREPVPDDVKSRKRMVALRRQLMNAALKHVQDGLEGSRNDRLREATDLTGIPLTLIDAALKAGIA